MDLRIEPPAVQTVADLAGVVAAVDTAGGARTLTLGPWTCEEAHLGMDAGAALRALLESAATWSRWPLRSFTICELGAAPDIQVLSALLQVLPSGRSELRHVRLPCLRLGLAGVQACAAVLRGREAGEPLLVDLSSNSLSDIAVEVLVPLLEARDRGSSPTVVGLNLSCNPQITDAGLRRLLGVPGAARWLQELDLSECSLGSAGAQVLCEHLAAEGCALRELSAYRCGLGVDGVLQVAAAASKAPYARSVSLVANAQHGTDWMARLGGPLAKALEAPRALRVLTVSCPEEDLQAAKEAFAKLPLRVVLVPNQQNNYNRALFLGAD